MAHSSQITESNYFLYVLSKVDLYPERDLIRISVVDKRSNCVLDWIYIRYSTVRSPEDLRAAIDMYFRLLLENGVV